MYMQVTAIPMMMIGCHGTFLAAVRSCSPLGRADSIVFGYRRRPDHSETTRPSAAGMAYPALRLMLTLLANAIHRPAKIPAPLHTAWNPVSRLLPYRVSAVTAWVFIAAS